MPAAYHTFLPHLRQGFIDKIETVDSPGSSVIGRAKLDLEINVQAVPIGGGSTALPPITQTIAIKGPGDITGINSSVIVKQYPSDWTTNFEPNYLPYIEFYDEDFPWRYTPAKAYHDTSGLGDNKFRLRPWISLIVLKEEEFKEVAFRGISPLIEIIANTYTDVFPNNTQTWAWSHVHVNADLGPIIYGANHEISQVPDQNGNPVSWRTKLADLESRLKANPDIAVSRILCPRRLEPNTGYHAFLIPTFEVGRRAGTGEDANNVNSLDPSWDTTSFKKEFPVYSRWFFKTGVGGDFESLVRMLRPRAVGNEAGKRDVDLQLPGNPHIDILDSPVKTIGLQGVLKPVGQTPDAWKFPTVPATPANKNDFVDHLRDILNETQTGTHPDPVVGPPIYGKWHAQKQKLSVPSLPNDWIDTVNLDPRYRLYAGIGTEVVRKNQDKYMAIAWEQVGEVIEANRRLRQMQLALEASQTIQVKHIESMNDELLLNITAPAHGKIKFSSTETVFKKVDDSSIPVTMLSGAFRRITSRSGALIRTLTASGLNVSTQNLIAAANSGTSLLSATYAAPTGMRSSAVPTSVLSAAGPGPTFSSLGSRSGFFPRSAGSTLGTLTAGPITTVSATRFVTAINRLAVPITGLTPYAPAAYTYLPLNTARQTINNTIRPANSVSDLAKKQILRSNQFATAPPVTKVAPVMAAPKINIPLYRDLVPISTEWMMPGLNTVPDNSICLLEMNQSYIEAFMLGANYEMARELLWRGFPTDQRGTYFSYFWEFNSSQKVDAVNPVDLDPFRDIYPIEQWRSPRGLIGSHTPLGANSPRLDANNANSTGLLVLTIRGELFRRYPNAQVYLQRAAWALDSSNNPLYNSPRVAASLAISGNKILPVFSSQVSPDIYFLGFAASASDLKGSLTSPYDPGFFFVFEEHSTEVKFGADEPDLQSPPSLNTVPNPAQTIIAKGDWNNLTWAHIALDPDFKSHINIDPDKFEIVQDPLGSEYDYSDEVNWGRNAASVAYTLLQAPVKLNVHAKDLIP